MHKNYIEVSSQTELCYTLYTMVNWSEGMAQVEKVCQVIWLKFHDTI